MEAVIKIQRLQQKFNMGSEEIIAVNDIDLEVLSGELLCLVGPSGSGKSTLLNLLGGLSRPTGGSIKIRGVEVTKLNETQLAIFRRQYIGFIFQSFNLIPTLTALENVELPMVFAGVPRQERRKRAKKLLGITALSNRENHKPSELSGGQQQRVSIARALVNDPEIILADEPTGNLDTKTSKEIIEVLSSLNREGAKTIVLVTHDLNIASYGHRVVHFRDGVIEKITSKEYVKDGVPQ